MNIYKVTCNGKTQRIPAPNPHRAKCDAIGIFQGQSGIYVHLSDLEVEQIPAFNAGDMVRIPVVVSGHDCHRICDVFTVQVAYSTGGAISYKLEESPSIWAETRLVTA